MSDDGFDENTLEFGEEHIEGGSDGGTTPFSSSNKRIKEIPIDRLSELPESLLIHILSFLGVKEAGVTSVLSKRWKFLWAELPRLEFWEDWRTKKPLDFVSWVNRTIGVRKGNYLEKFVVQFFNRNECCASDFDAWIEFCVKNQVKELGLIIYTDYYYKPPWVMYSCYSLTNLHLKTCILSSESRIGWQSLTRLSLDDVELNQCLIDDILANCKALYDLALEACWGFSRLRIDSRSLNRLTIDESEKEPFLEISAPYIRSLDIMVFPQERKWQLRNISSVVKAVVKFWEIDGGFSVEEIGNVKEFLEHFKHVDDLNVWGVCFEAVSLMASNGWQLQQFKLRHLTITCWSEYALAIAGVICLLDSSPNLEMLLLEGDTTEGEIVDFAPAVKDDLDGDLLHLKKIRVNNFADSNGEPMLTLAQILLNRAPALEEMVVAIDVENTSDLFNIAQALLTYPRSSTKAKIHLLSRK